MSRARVACAGRPPGPGPTGLSSELAWDDESGGHHMAMAMAILRDDREALELLIIRHGPNPAHDGQTPLGLACDRGRAECVELLLADPRVHIDRKSRLGRSPALLAAARGHERGLRLLVDAGASLSSGRGGGSPLGAALAEGRLECVRLLAPLSDPADVGAGPRGALARARRTMLRRSSPGALHLVRALLPWADPGEATADEGETPLMIAAACGMAECVGALLPRSDAAVRDFCGRSALDHAIDSQNPDCVALLASQARCEPDRAGRTPLMRAVAWGALDCVEPLLPFSSLSARDERRADARECAMMDLSGQKREAMLALLDAWIQKGELQAAVEAAPSGAKAPRI